tara:strand:+ start:1090 stop:1269 length:180 start_codon:yes stop_codon:yes gene_type:complete
MSNLPDMMNEAFFKAHIKPLIDRELAQTPEGMRLNVNLEVDEKTGLQITFTHSPMEESQ